MMSIIAQPVPMPPNLPAKIQLLGSGSGPMTNAERQQRWRDKHRGRRRKDVFVAPPQPAAAPCVRAAHGGVASAGAVAGAIAADAAVALRAVGGARGKVRDVFDAHVRPLSAAGRLQLMRMIVDSLAAAA